MLLEARVGPATGQDGTPRELRTGRQFDLINSDAHGRYFEATRIGQQFTLVLTATTTGVAAGNIVGAAAAAVTQFALINPLGSGKNLVLVKFGMGIISGTPGAGPLWHGYIPQASSITAAALANFTGVIRSNMLGSGPASVAQQVALAAGSALTGGLAPVTHRMANFSSTATAQASVNEVNAIEEIAGDLTLPPGTAWLPLWSAQGTSLLNGYSITWEEVPL